jgi:hypothetical protein
MNDVASIFSAIYRRRITVLLIWGSALVAGFFYAKKTPTEYLAVSKVMIPAQAPTVTLKSEGGNIPDGPILPNEEEEMRVGIIGIIGSGAVHDRVAEMLPSINPKTIRKNVVGDIGRDSYLNILAYGSTAEEAAMLSNTFNLAFQDEMQAILEVSPRRTLKTIAAQEPIAWRKYSQLSDELVAYLKTVGLVDVEGGIAQWVEQREKIQQQIEDTEILYRSQLAQRPVYESLLQNRPEFVLTQQSLSENKIYVSANERLNKLSTDLALKKIEYRAKHPEIIKVLQEIDLVEDQLNAQVDMTLTGSTLSQDAQALEFAKKLSDIEIAIASYNVQRQIYEARAEELDSKLSLVPGVRAEVALRSALINQARSHADDLSARRAELEFHLGHGLRFTLSNEYAAAVPEKAVPLPTPLGIMIFCGLAGLVFGLLVAVVSELIKQLRLRSPY